MPHIHPNPSSLIGKPKVGDGNCVALLKETIPTLKGISTADWRPGEHVLESKNLKPGTAIATFLCGKYPQDGTTGKHAAIFLRYWGKPNADGTYDAFLVIDQWHSRIAIATRELQKKGRVTSACTGGIYNASNVADAFYVVETRKK